MDVLLETLAEFVGEVLSADLDLLVNIWQNNRNVLAVAFVLESPMC